MFRRQFVELVDLLPQHGLFFVKFHLSPMLNHQRCHHPARGNGSDNNNFEMPRDHMLWRNVPMVRWSASEHMKILNAEDDPLVKGCVYRSFLCDHPIFFPQIVA